MNILSICYESICIQIAKNINAKELHFVVCPKKNKMKKLDFVDNSKIKSFSHRFLKVGRTFKKVDWNKIKPLSASLIEKMSFCEAETLRMFERIKIDPSLYNNRKKHYLNHLRFWSDYLDKNKIDVLFRYSPPHMGYDNVIYHLAKLKKIKIIMVYQFYSKFTYLTYNDVRDPLPNFKNKMIEFLKSDFEFKYKEIKALYEYHSSKKIPKVLPVVIPSKLTQNRRIRKNKAIINYYNQKAVKPNYKEQYIYFPLHYQYEATTCPLGGVFVDQFLALDIISQLEIKIYVKEHPRVSNNRSKEYYNRILSIKNVNLISSEEPNYKLIDNAKITAVISGTAGWESILRGKPVFIFGYHFWQYAPGVFRITSENDARKQFKLIEKYKPDCRKIKAWFRTFESYLFADEPLKVMEALKNEIEEGENIEA